MVAAVGILMLPVDTPSCTVHIVMAAALAADWAYWAYRMCTDAGGLWWGASEVTGGPLVMPQVQSEHVDVPLRRSKGGAPGPCV